MVNYFILMHRMGYSQTSPLLMGTVFHLYSNQFHNTSHSINITTLKLLKYKSSNSQYPNLCFIDHLDELVGRLGRPGPDPCPISYMSCGSGPGLPDSLGHSFLFSTSYVVNVWFYFAFILFSLVYVYSFFRVTLNIIVRVHFNKFFCIVLLILL